MVSSVKTFLTNFDFEICLQRQNFKRPTYNKINSTLEYFFFWCDDGDKLYTEKKYSKEYLSYVSNLSGNTISITNDKKARLSCWWGKLDTNEDFLFEKEINSNVLASQARNDLGFNELNSEIIYTQEELFSAISKRDKSFIIKHNFGFSGSGLAFKPQEVKQFPVCIEDWVKRVRDFGIYVSCDEYYVVQNHINPIGAYKGSLVKRFKEESLYSENAKRIYEYYSQFGVNQIQIDAFQYLENSQIKNYFLCEVNHRKSMGQLAFELARKFGDGVSFMALVNKKDLKSLHSFNEIYAALGELNYNPITKRGVISLSSSQELFQAFLLCEESERTLQFIITDWWKKVGKKGKKLPMEYIVNL